jgi:hypothetical protein
MWEGEDAGFAVVVWVKVEAVDSEGPRLLVCRGLGY